MPSQKLECKQTKQQMIGNKALEYTGSYLTVVKWSYRD